MPLASASPASLPDALLVASRPSQLLSIERCDDRLDQPWRPLSEWATSATSAPGRRWPSAMRSVEDQVGAHVGGELPAHDPPRVRVDDEGEEHHALPVPPVGEIVDPQAVGRRGAEVTPDQIGPPLGVLVGGGGAPPATATLGALDGLLAHQALDPAAAHLFAGAAQRLPHAPVAIGAVGGLMHLADHARQPLVFHPARRALAGGALVVGRRRGPDRAADELDPEARTMRVDERAHFGRVGSR